MQDFNTKWHNKHNYLGVDLLLQEMSIKEVDFSEISVILDCMICFL